MALEHLPGVEPPAAPWGCEVVHVGPELRRRIRPEPAAAREVAVVLGAAGALGPDLVHALLLRGHGAVVGIDVTITYRCSGAVYRAVDLRRRDAVLAFYRDLRREAAACGLSLGATYDLSTVQTSPGREHGVARGALEDSKLHLFDALCEEDGDATLFYMSSGEVYGAPPGAPYREDHEKRPFNPYARAKWREEQAALGAHGRATRGGRLRVVALRTWTIAMVTCDAEGRILAARNYNDPLMMVAQRLASAGVRPPLPSPDVLCQFHMGEEVAELALLLASEPPDSPAWGRAFNATARPATAGRLVDIAFEVFRGAEAQRPWWSTPARVLLGHARLPVPVLAGAAHALQRFGGLLGARDVGGRLPFLFRSTHMDDAELRALLRGRLTEPDGSTTEHAVERLALGMRRAGAGSLAARRYRAY